MAREPSFAGGSRARSGSPMRRDRRSERRSRSPTQDREEKEGVHGHERRRHRDDDLHHTSRHDSSRHHSHRHHRHHRHRSADRSSAPVNLPFDARTLSKSDYPAFRALFAYYLDLQKGKDLLHMDEREVRGRWKSFVSKWNRGELREGWYDPEMYQTAQERMDEMMELEPQPEVSEALEPGQADPSRREREIGRVEVHGVREPDDDSDDSDDMGPALPSTVRSAATQRSGPGIPTIDELAARREELAEEAADRRTQQIEELRYARVRGRKEQKERLEELVPRADPGSRERRLEKRAAVNEKMKGFREGSPGGDAAVGDGELMGGGAGDDLRALRRQKEEAERRKTEREVRREEIARAKAEEREERVRDWKEREEGTMKALKELAKQRFG